MNNFLKKLIVFYNWRKLFYAVQLAEDEGKKEYLGNNNMVGGFGDIADVFQ